MCRSCPGWGLLREASLFLDKAVALRLHIAVPVSVLVCGLVFGSTSALAGRGFAAYPFGATAGGLAQPVGVAVDSSAGLSKGDVYVSNSTSGMVDKFNTVGGELLGEVAVASNPALRGIAVDAYPGADEGDVYVAGQGTGVLYRLSPALVLEKEITGLGDLTGVAVDKAADIFVSKEDGTVAELNPEGKTIDAAVAQGLSSPQGVAVNAEGTSFYVATLAGTLEYTLSGGVYVAAAQPLDAAASYGTAISPTGDVYVDQGSEVAEYEPSGGVPLLTFGAGVLAAGFGVAVNEESGEVYVADLAANTVYRFEEGATPETPSKEAASEIQATTATLTGELIGGGSGYYFAYNTGASCAGGAKSAAETAGGSKVSIRIAELQAGVQYTFCLVATNGYGETYGPGISFETKPLPAIESLEATGLTDGAAVLDATVDPKGLQVTTCLFEVGSETTYGQILPCEQTPTGDVPQVLTAKLSSLKEAGTYHYRLYLLSTNGPVYSEDHQLTTLGAQLGAEAVSQIQSGAALLTASVDPLGVPSTYHFEYGTSSTYGSDTPAESLGTASGTVKVSAQANGLLPGTEYHFRIVVSSENGATAQGVDEAFRTLPMGIVGLPDGRTYEMVTPPENENATVEHPLSWSSGSANGLHTFSRLTAVAADGDAITYLTNPIAGGNGKEGEQDLAARSAAGGWSQAAISPRGIGGLYQGFAENLSSGVLLTTPELLPEILSPATGFTLVERNLTNVMAYGFDPIIGAVPSNPQSAPLIPTYVGSSADGSQVIFQANAALTANAESPRRGPQPEVPEEENLYDSTAGRLALVNVLPDGSSQVNAAFGNPVGNGHGRFGISSNVISADGSRVFWTDLNTGDLYVRENANSENASTVEVDAAASGAPGPSGAGRFWDASRDGSKVFFTDENQLTDGSTAAPGESDLYEDELGSQPGVSGKLTDLTVDARSGEHAGVQGVLGVGDDGSYVYFVAKGVLSENENSEREKAEPQTCQAGGLCNLYVLHRGEAPKFITALLNADGEEMAPYFYNGNGNSSKGVAYGDWQTALGARTAEASPDGRALVFMSARSLTGYHNGGLAEVYLYQFEGARLFCVSCSSSGEAPTRSEDQAAAFLPVPSDTEEATMQWISDDDSRVFFDSAVPLVARDVNGNQDVYEWEREGSGSCQEQPGCVYLISSGTSPDASWLLGAGISGNDVFVATRAQLLAEDHNENYDLYDARIGGTQSVSETACSGTGCQGIPSAPPAFATPTSVTFSGAANFPPPSSAARQSTAKTKTKVLTRAQKFANALKKCRREPKRRRAACASRARRRYGKVRAARRQIKARRRHHA
jgi:hypothetical protein